MDKLPVEVLDNICATLSRQDLKQSRLVCRGFKFTAEKRLYHTLYVYPNIDSLYRARCITKEARLSGYVKRLLYKCLGIPSASTFDEWRKYYLGHGWLDKYEKRELEKLFDNSTLMHHYWQYKNYDNGQDVVDQVKVINSLLRQISLCPGLNELEFSYEYDDYCPVENPNGTFDALSTFRSADRLTQRILAIPTPGWGVVAIRQHFFALLNCWRKSTTSFKGRDLPWVIFRPGKGERLGRLPSMITMKSMVLEIQMDEGRRDQIYHCNQLAGFINRAKTLESLEPSFKELPIGNAAAKLSLIFPKRYFWPSLRRLCLQAMSAPHKRLQELLGRLRHTLRWLELKDIRLLEEVRGLENKEEIQHGSWIVIIKFLQKKLNLGHVQLGGFLTNCWDEAWQGRCPEETPLSNSSQKCKAYMKEQIETFIVHGGPYPLEGFESADKREWRRVATDLTWQFKQRHLKQLRALCYLDLRWSVQTTDTAAAGSLCKSPDTFDLTVYRLAQTFLLFGLEEPVSMPARLTLFLEH
ncbi:MAG: hypothetical protein LQ342_004003 [Letrouitia transgressa]|nr:MAG: hypothetical protein LQ342_004003 [Letrouitia transgressa]